MADRSLLFSAPMVRALLAGTKTQTRRVLKPQPFIDDMGNFCVPRRKGGHWNYGQHMDGRPCVRNFAEGLPIKVGDRLWVREAHHRTNDSDDSHLVGYDFADGHVPREGLHHIDGVGEVLFFRHSLGGWGGRTSRNYPGMFMPRWASRLTLTVTDVRVQRLQDITEGDARAEGTQEPSLREMGGDFAQAAWSERQVFQRLWDSINSRRGLGWAANPWVAAYTFAVDRRNIDAVPA